MINCFQQSHYFLLLLLFFFWSIILHYIAAFLIDRINFRSFFIFPFFECFMTLSYLMLWQSSVPFWPYFIFFSALAITIQTDFSCMLISRFVSLYLAPTGVVLSYFQMLPIHWIESIISCLVGYGFLYLINKIFFIFKKQNGLGQGDFDLMALIGAYSGILGIWFTILWGSIIGTVTVLLFMVYKRKSISHIPFGPFLSLAAMIFVLFQKQIIDYLL